MRIKISISIMLYFSICSILHAQQLPSWSSYDQMGYIWNPALTAMSEMSEIAIAHRQEWSDFNNAPKYSTLGFQLPINRTLTKTFFGALFENDQTGPFRKTGVGLFYAYKITPNLSGKDLDQLRIGLSAKINKFRYSNQDVIAFDGVDDTSISEIPSDKNQFNFNAGIFYKSLSDPNERKSHYYLGLSVNNLMKNKLTAFEDNGDEITASRHIFANLGYAYFPKDSSNHFFEFSANLAQSFQKNTQVSGLVKYERLDKYWLALGITSNTNAQLQAGLILNNKSLIKNLIRRGILKIGSRININFGSLRKYSDPGYELFLAYSFERKKS